MGINDIDLSKVRPIIEDGLKANRMILEANKILNNADECFMLLERMAEAQLLLSFIHEPPD